MRKRKKLTEKELRYLSEAILNERGKRNFKRSDTGESLNNFISYVYNLRKTIMHLTSKSEVAENDVREGYDFRILYNTIVNQLPEIERYFYELKQRYNF